MDGPLADFFHMGIPPKGGGCKGLPGWFGALFSTFARLTEGGGLKLFVQCPYKTNTITHLKKGLPLQRLLLPVVKWDTFDSVAPGGIRIISHFPPIYSPSLHTSMLYNCQMAKVGIIIIIISTETSRCLNP